MADAGGDDEDVRPADKAALKPLSAAIRLGVSLICAACIVVMLAGPPPRHGVGASVLSRLLALLIFGIVLVWFTRRHYYLPITRSHVDTKVFPLPDAHVYAVQRGAGTMTGSDALTVEQAKTFAIAVLAPTSVRERITERYEPGQRTLTQRVTIEAQLPDVLRRRAENPPDPTGGTTVEIPRTVMFPVLIPPKGLLIDNLRVLAADGSDLPILSYRQYLRLVARVLRTLLNVAYNEPIRQTTHGAAFEAEHLALAGVLRRGKPSEEDDMSGAIRLQQLTATDPEAVKMAASLARRLASHYAVVAAVPWPSDNRLVVTYERQITPTLQMADRSLGWIKWLKARARLLLGARPVDISVPLENACTAQSYHLLIDGQEGVFVGSQQSPNLIAYCAAHAARAQKMLDHPPGDPPPPPYYRFRRRAGQRYAHFYTRYFPEPVTGLSRGDSLPSVRFRFFEIPPGSVFRATVAALAATLLLWLIGVVSSRKADPGTDAPAFLLVFPAIAAAWLGYEGTAARRLLEGTLAARLSLMVTALTSVAACGLFMVYKSQLPYLHWPNPAGISVLGNTSLSWTVLMLISTLNASIIGYLYLTRSWEFTHLASRADDLTDHLEHGG